MPVRSESQNARRVNISLDRRARLFVCRLRARVSHAPPPEPSTVRPPSPRVDKTDETCAPGLDPSREATWPGPSMDAPLPFATGAPTPGPAADVRANKRGPLESSPLQPAAPPAPPHAEEDLYAANRRLMASGAAPPVASDSFGAVHFGERSAPPGMDMPDPGQARKRLRRGRDDESGPPSSSHSHITSPAQSDSSGPALTSPVDPEFGSAQPDDAKPPYLEIRSHLSQFALNSQPGSSASSPRGSVPPSGYPGPAGSSNDAATDFENRRRAEEDVKADPQSSPPVQRTGRLVRGERPSAPENLGEVDIRSSPATLPQLQQLQQPQPQQQPSLSPQPSTPLPPHLSEDLFNTFWGIVLKQPQQLGIPVPTVRSIWIKHGGNNSATFSELTSLYTERTRVATLAQQQQAAQAQAQQQHYLQQQQQRQNQELYQQQVQQQRHYGQNQQQFYAAPQQPAAYPPAGYPPQYAQQYPPGAYPQGQYPPGQYRGPPQQAPFLSPYGNRPPQQQQYAPGGRILQNGVSRAHELQRPRPPTQQHTTYQPRGSYETHAPRVTVLPRYSQPLPPAPPLRKRKPAASDSDGEENYSDNSADEYGGPSPAVLAARAARAMSFFNECTKDELTEMASCNAGQATLVFKLRPFLSETDFRARTRKQKGVGNNMFDTYLQVTDGMAEVDKVLDDCEQIGRDLSAVMRIWTGVDPGAAGPAAAADVGTNLVAIADDKLLAMAGQSHDPAVIAAFQGYLRKQPDGVPSKIVLKDYQMLGVNWLALLYRRKTSCILADEMGLGKTAQVIALMSHLKSIGEKGPHLVIVPSSTLENWMREFSVFAPGLVTESYYGSQADRASQRYELKEAETLDVIVTTYNIATSSPEDQKFLRKSMKFNIAIFDEGHQLKNSESKKYKDLMGIKAKWRCLLTGTPLQNNLQELVSLLSFILPDQFRDANESLRAIFKVGPSSSANLLSRERVTRAKKMMTPFVLRRKKAQVLKDLPKKFERVELCEMTPLQREVHSEAMQRSKRALADNAEDVIESLALPDDDEALKMGRTGSKTGNKTNENSGSNVLMDLRKASNHPMLFRRLYTDKLLRTMAKECLKEEEFVDRDKQLIYEDMEVMTDFELHRFCGGYKYLSKYCLQNEEWMSAGKIIALQRMLPEMKERGDRILLFSQFTQMLEILEVVLDTMGIKYLKLTGQTNVTERQGMVDQFTNDPDITVFLLSTRAGGLGLNLTAANTVIMHDQDFNPHADKQAEDRSYRIGQVRDVTVIKLICADSVEQMMRDMAAAKLQLDSEVSSTSQYPTGVLTPSDEGLNQAQSERKMRTTLLSNLKANFDKERDEGR